MKKWLVAAILATAAGRLLAQQPSPPVIFRAEVNYVELDAIVTDAQGNVVSDLTQRDFEVLEDGKPQKLATFAHVELPIEKAERPLFASAPIQPDVQTNRAVEGRIYLIVLDDNHTAAARTFRVKAAARRFIEQNFGVNDLAAVVFTGRNDAAQDFTNNPRLLLAAIDKFVGNKLPSATRNQLETADVFNANGVAAGTDVNQQERAYRARAAMSSIRKLSEFLAGVRGRRKALLLIGEGFDYDIDQVMGNEGSTASLVIEDTRNAIAAATRANVAIYGIDPRGLPVVGDDLVDTGGFVVSDASVGTASLQKELRLSQQSLRALSVDTGGFAAVNTNDFDTAFSRIVKENSSYYLLGYYPTNDKRDGRLRKLQVRVMRPGVTVRSRSGYVAPSGKAAAATTTSPDAPPAVVTEALGSPLPVPGVPMRMFAGPFKGAAPNAAVAIALELDASQFNFVNRGGAWVEQVDVLTSAMNAAGKSFPGERQKLTLTLKPDTYERVVRNGLRVVTQMDLPPGRYQLRMAAGNATKAGSVLYGLEVPDFGKGAIALSGIALTSKQAANDLGTIRPKNPLGDYLPGPPVATREFHQGDTLTLFAEVYENAQSRQAHQVSITTELRNDVGQVVAQTSERRSSGELQGRSGGYGFTSDLSLNGIAPGLYVIHVDAQSQVAGTTGVSRDLQIRVIP
jgi:VWFA-related protein